MRVAVATSAIINRQLAGLGPRRPRRAYEGIAPALRVGNLLFLAGTTATDENGKWVSPLTIRPSCAFIETPGRPEFTEA